jgi:hypothetical protein
LDLLFDCWKFCSCLLCLVGTSSCTTLISMSFLAYCLSSISMGNHSFHAFPFYKRCNFLLKVMFGY